MSKPARKALEEADEHVVAAISWFPGDPADRLIYATAIEHGLNLVTKDRAIRDHDGPQPVATW